MLLNYNMTSQVSELVRKIYKEQLDAPRLTSKRWEALCTVLGAALAVLSLIGTVYYYNIFITGSNLVSMDSAQIIKEKDRIRNLVPNLIQVTVNHSNYEKSIFFHTAESRQNLIKPKNLETEMKNLAAMDVDKVYSKLIAIAEKYPNLRTNIVFLQLMKNLYNGANRVAAAREKYNIDVRAYNNKRSRFPAIIFALLFHFEKLEFYNGDTGIKLPAVGQFER
ncbi:MAG: LemA family protein [Elusimicrobia bacterium]|nr:LemA family protein [Candidatus Liberimonas magnetica]